MYFTSEERKIDVSCFKDLAASIIRERDNNKEDNDKTQIIKSALKLTQNEIALVNMNSSLYPSISAKIDLNGQLNLKAESLKLFLKHLLKQCSCFAFCVQSIIKISKPRSGVLPLSMHFALQLKHGFKQLLDKMHSFGFSESYHEVMYFHSMGMIKESTKSAAVTDNYLSSEMRRSRR